MKKTTIKMHMLGIAAAVALTSGIATPVSAVPVDTPAWGNGTPDSLHVPASELQTLGLSDTTMHAHSSNKLIMADGCIYLLGIWYCW